MIGLEVMGKGDYCLEEVISQMLYKLMGRTAARLFKIQRSEKSTFETKYVVRRVERVLTVNSVLAGSSD